MRAMEMEGRLTLARELVRHLEAGDGAAADEVLERMARARESTLFAEIGRLTRELHDALTSLKLDERIASLTQCEIPDVKQRLRFVIQKTEDAAHRTLNAVETSMPIVARIREAAERIDGLWARFMQRQMPLAEFRELCGEVGRFLGEAHADAAHLQASLSEVLLAQEFQDLTGQVIRRIIDVVTEVEDNLVRLIRCSGGTAQVRCRPEEAARGEGPYVCGTGSSGQHVNGQDEVDALLSSLGF